MAHEVLASVTVILPDDPKEMADGLSVMAGAWSEFLTQLSGNMACEPAVTFQVNETRAKPKPANGGTPRQPRKPRVAAGEDDLLADQAEEK